MTTVSVLLPFMPTRPEHAIPYAAFVQYRGAYRLWQGQSLSLEPHQLFSYLAAAGFRIPVGIGVTLMPLRHPMEAALQVRSVAAATGKPVVVGFGPGASSLQRSVGGAPYRRPLVATREYVTIVRALLAGDSLAYDGVYFTQWGTLPKLPDEAVEVGVGVLRPGMARLAGEVADVAITWLTPPDYLAGELVPALRAGAEAAGRRRPRLVAMVPMALRAPDRDPVDLVLAGNGLHLQQPHYRDMLRRAGLRLAAEDLTADARALLAAGGFCYGDPAELSAYVDAYRAAGVDEVVVNMTAVCRLHGARTTLSELSTLFEVIPA